MAANDGDQKEARWPEPVAAALADGKREIQVEPVDAGKLIKFEASMGNNLDEARREELHALFMKRFDAGIEGLVARLIVGNICISATEVGPGYERLVGAVMVPLSGNEPAVTLAAMVETYPQRMQLCKWFHTATVDFLSSHGTSLDAGKAGGSYWARELFGLDVVVDKNGNYYNLSDAGQDVQDPLGMHNSKSLQGPPGAAADVLLPPTPAEAAACSQKQQRKGRAGNKYWFFQKGRMVELHPDAVPDGKELLPFFCGYLRPTYTFMEQAAEVHAKAACDLALMAAFESRRRSPEQPSPPALKAPPMLCRLSSPEAAKKEGLASMIDAENWDVYKTEADKSRKSGALARYLKHVAAGEEQGGEEGEGVERPPQGRAPKRQQSTADASMAEQAQQGGAAPAVSQEPAAAGAVKELLTLLLQAVEKPAAVQAAVDLIKSVNAG